MLERWVTRLSSRAAPAYLAGAACVFVAIDFWIGAPVMMVSLMSIAISMVMAAAWKIFRGDR